MQFFLRHRTFVIIFAILLIGVSLYLVTKKDTGPDWVTGTVEKGVVRELVSVSGIIEAKSEATLSFPTTGVISDLFVAEGNAVLKDQILATLEQSTLIAERQDAYGTLLIAQADRDELISGPRSEARAVTDTTVAIARAELERAISEQEKEVTNTYRTLLSDDLEALPTDLSTSATPPLITGTYLCGKEGSYTIEVFGSNAQSGYSYRLSGLESGTFTAFTESPAPLGTCGLSIQFLSDESYGNKSWTVLIPNTRSSSYTTNLNAYQSAKEQEKNAIASARETYDKALREQTLENAHPRDEALVRADAAVLQAEARLAKIDADIKNKTLIAPFDGIVSNIALSRGEVAEREVLTLVASNAFELTTRIPEIDIARISVGQQADVEFDAQQNELLRAGIEFISPVATEIDGVAYFEAKLRFDTPPPWMRSGLNADLDIIINEMHDVLTIPRRFLVTEGESTFVLVPEGVTTRRETVSVVFTGNDGYIAVSGNIREGDTIIAP